jgi:hypothetical protein
MALTQELLGTRNTVHKNTANDVDRWPHNSYCEYSPVLITQKSINQRLVDNGRKRAARKFHV